MGQRQGLLVLSGLAVVMVLLALASSCGAFDDEAGSVADGSRTNPNADQGAAGGADGAAGAADGGGADGLKGSAKASKVLLDSVQHYSDLFTAGQKIVGTTRYTDPVAYSKAYADPASPAAALAKFRISPNPEADTTYLAAAERARVAYGKHPSALNQWSRDMETTKEDLGNWVATAAQYQQGAAAQADLDAAAATVTKDLATVRGDVAAVAG